MTSQDSASIGAVEPSPLRPDARPFELKRLTADQLLVHTNVHRRLKEIAVIDDGTDVPAKQPAFLPIIRKQQTNQVLLIEGARGSGKTSVLLRVLEDLRTQWMAPPEQNSFCFAPLHIIDLQTLRPDIDLTLAVIQEIEPFISAIEEARSAADGRAEKPPSRQAWKALVSGYLASTGASPAALALVSRDTAADLSENAHRRRVAFPRDFSLFMEKLVEDGAATFKRGRPIFLVPVDDADMQPSRLMDLLTVLHTLRHPRLVYLLTGHERLFLDVFRRSFANQLGDGSPQIADLALQTMSKMVPAAHRFHLRPLRLSERLEQVRDLLKNEKAPTGTLGKWEPLLSYLERFPLLQAALPARLRSIADLATRQSEGDAFGVAQYLWENACDDDPHANVARQTISISSNPRTVELSKLRLRADCVNIYSYSVRNFTIGIRRPQTFAVGHVNAAGKMETYWSTDASAAALLAMSLAADDEDGYFDEFPKHAAGSPPTFVGVRSPSWLTDEIEIGWPFPPFESPMALVEVGEAVAELSRQLPRLKTQDAVDMAARGLVSIATALGARRPPSHQSPGSWQTLVAEAREATANLTETYDRRRNALITWIRQSLLLFAAPESGLSMAEARHLIDALRREFGEETFASMAQLVRAERSRRFEEAIRRAGMDNAETDPRGLAESILLRIQEDHAGHAWYEYVDTRRGYRKIKGSNTLQRFMNALGRFKLGKPATNPGATNWRSLADYFNIESRLRFVLETDWIKTFIEGEVAERWDISRHAEGCVVDLWRIACEERRHPELSRLVTFSRGQLRIGAPAGLAVASTPGLVNLRSSAQMLLAVGAADGGVRCALPRSLDDDVLSFLIGIARDLYVDTARADEDSGALEPVSAFPFVTAHSMSAPPTGAGVHPWPSIGWAAPVEWDLLLEAWGEAVADLRAKQGTGAEDDEEHIIDGLAFRYLQICHAVSQRQASGSTLELAVPDAAWVQVFDNLEAAGRNATTAMKGRIKDFLERRHLLATPEAGLSRIACTLILATYPTPPERARVVREREHRVGKLPVARPDGQKHPWDNWLEKLR